MDWQELTDRQVLEALAVRLRDYRIHKKYTQKELAEKSGISVHSIQKIEQGKAVSLEIFLSVLRTLRLLNQFRNLVPDRSVSPIELWEKQGAKRQRVRK